MQFLTAIGNTERGELHFAAVLRPGKEVKDCLLLEDNALLLVPAVSNALGTKEQLPIFCRNFNLVLEVYLKRLFFPMLFLVLHMPRVSIIFAIFAIDKYLFARDLDSCIRK